MVEYIHNNLGMVAMIIRATFNKPGIEFFTPHHFSQQVGYMNRKAGHIIAPHTHKKVERLVQGSQEVLYLKSGKVKADFYDENQEIFASTNLVQGDVILIISGGHGFEILEDAEMIEIKQGPFIEDDKVGLRLFNKKIKQLVPFYTLFLDDLLLMVS